MLAQTIEARDGCTVERRLNLGGTFICDRALRSGDIDAVRRILGHGADGDLPSAGRDGCRAACSRRSGSRYAAGGLTLLDPLGFENTFAMLVRGDDAGELALNDHRVDGGTVRARHGGRALATNSCSAQDGYPGAGAGLRLALRAPPTAMDLSLIYRALAERQVDLIAGDATSGLIDAYGLTMLEDDRHYFPPYDAAVVARSATLLAHPEVKTALAQLVGPHHRRRHAAHEPRGRRGPSRSRRRRAGVPGADASRERARRLHSLARLEDDQVMASQNSFITRTRLTAGGDTVQIFSLPALERAGLPRRRAAAVFAEDPAREPAAL